MLYWCFNISSVESTYVITLIYILQATKKTERGLLEKKDNTSTVLPHYLTERRILQRKPQMEDVTFLLLTLCQGIGTSLH